MQESTEKLIAQPNFKQLVSPQWINSLINKEQLFYPPKKDYKIIEVQWGPPAKYLAAHIPTALYLNTNDIETEPWWNRVDNNKLTELLNDLGIRYDTTVILYGRNNMAAARAANIMMYAGVTDVRLLNGGWSAWLNADMPTEPFMNSNNKQVTFGKIIPSNPGYIIDIPQAKELLKKDPNLHSLVSVRTWAEYTGLITGYDYIKEKGRISGSKWGHAGTNANNVLDFLNPDGTMKSARAITELWNEMGINKDQQLSFFCGTGWRASEVFFYAYVMGGENISVFDGGWYEWSADKNNATSSGAMIKNSTKN